MIEVIQKLELMASRPPRVGWLPEEASRSATSVSQSLVMVSTDVILCDSQHESTESLSQNLGGSCSGC